MNLTQHLKSCMTDIREQDFVLDDRQFTGLKNIYSRSARCQVQELQDSIEHPGLCLAQSGLFCENFSLPGCSL